MTQRAPILAADTVFAPLRITDPLEPISFCPDFIVIDREIRYVPVARQKVVPEGLPLTRSARSTFGPSWTPEHAAEGSAFGDGVGVAVGEGEGIGSPLGDGEGVGVGGESVGDGKGS
jgi:hypothetical protein